MLTNFKDVEFVFVAPDVVRMGDDIKEELDKKGFKWSESDDLLSVASEVDVLYQTRIQRERFKDLKEYEACRGIYTVDKKIMDALPKSSVVMHPLPRLDEITVEVDDDPRAAYFRQAKNGLFIRMALLKVLLKV
jgi:aspartate carbamoyltransferase catalytic subunit